MASIVFRLQTVIFASLFAFAFSVFAEVKTHRTDWAEISFPTAASVGEPVDVSIKVIQAIPEGSVLAADLYWMKADGGFGGMLSYGERKAFKSGQPVNFRFNVGAKSGMGSVQVTAFTSPDGNWDSRKQVLVAPNLPIVAITQSAVQLAWVRESLDWATIEYPASAASGDTFDVKLTVKQAVPAGTQAAADLYWMKVDGGFGGMLSFGPRKAVTSGQTQTFRFTVPAKEGVAKILSTAFISPDGNWDSRIESISGPNVPISKVQTVDVPKGNVRESLGWADIEYPAGVTVGGDLPVKLTLKEPVPAGTQLAADLYWMKTDGGFGGLLSFGLRQPAEVGKVQTFLLKVGEKPGMGSVQVTAFTSPDGDWNQRQQVIRGPGVPVFQGTQVGQVAGSAIPDSVTFKKSWISVKSPEGPFVEGDRFTVTVDYYLDPSETWGRGTELFLSAHGPWVDNPDGTYTKGRSHHAIQGLTGTKGAKLEPGRGQQTFEYTVPALHPFNDLLFIAGFKMDGGAKNWPWYVRGHGPELTKTHANYDLGTAQIGNLFTYGQPLEIEVRSREGAQAGASKELTYTLIDTNGRVVEGTSTFVAAAPGGKATVRLPYSLRGTFVLKTSVEGWGDREMVFAYIPDVSKIIGEAPTAFGVTNVETEAENAIAQKLGFRWVRHFFSWTEVRPGPDYWDLDKWDRVLERNQSYGLQPWLCLVYPPAWVQTGSPKNVPYVPYGFDPEALTSTVKELSTRWADQIWGWEWQNEIVPGDLVENPVENYIDFNRVGTAAVRASVPDLKVQLAGGLWPRNFRNDLLKQGVAQYIDVLPVHYGNDDTIRDAQKDLAVIGEKDRIKVWDNESSSGLSVWGMPLTEMIQVSSQSEWIMDRWAAELSAGVEQITLFGGHIEPAGNWSYLLDAQTVRPYATTAAVFISKLAHAEALGTFYFGDGGLAHLFDRDGHAVLVVSSPAKASSLTLPVGSETLTMTDHQGREQLLTAPDGQLTVQLTPTPVFLEGANLNFLKTQLVLNVGASDRPVASPQITAVRASGLSVPIQLSNPYDRPLPLTIGFRQAGSRQLMATQTIDLSAGETKSLEVPVSNLPAQGSASSVEKWVAVVDFPGTRLHSVERPFSVAWVDPAYLGNLLKNPGFESGVSPWFISGKGTLIPSEGALGAGDQMLELKSDTQGWLVSSQEIEAPAGQSYLFSLWAHPEGLQQGGANITYVLPEGKKKELYIPHVFQTPSDSDSWMLLTYRGTVPDNAEKVQFIPVANGGNDGGRMRVDNVRVSLYEGTNYAAEAKQVSTAPRIDGSLDDWDRSCPIPLLAVNQLIANSDAYQWSPDNLSGVAYLQWDLEALYLAVEVIDDQAVQPATGNQTIESDSLTFALQPARLGESSNDRAFAYYLSAASPGGGSGRYTLFRPEAYAGGLVSGHLAKDSSAYEIVIRREGTRTFYEVRFPWAELGGVTPRLGTRLGLSLSLVDNDGSGPAAKMLWGEGLDPVWEPSQFGVLTLVK